MGMVAELLSMISRIHGQPPGSGWQGMRDDLLWRLTAGGCMVWPPLAPPRRSREADQSRRRAGADAGDPRGQDERGAKESRGSDRRGTARRRQGAVRLAPAR